MKRAKFSLSNEKLLSCNMGSLVPIGLTEVLPGDSIQQSTSLLLRAAPLLSPVMHKVDVRIHHWYVPHRLVWEDFEDFITGGPTGTDASVFPTVTSVPGYAAGSLADYLGIPITVPNIVASALPFRGYAMIWNEWYRDQDLQTELVIDDTSGADTTTNQNLQNCAWEKDYFTSSRPWEQKGPAISIPLGQYAPVERVSNAAGMVMYNTGTNVQASTANVQINPVTANQRLTGAAGVALSMDPVGGLRANLTGASAITVGALREAMALQRYEENRARYGSRYVEYLRYLGVASSDARLQRPEYLGGGRAPIQFSEVLQTAEGTEPVGQMAGHGIAAMRSNRYRRFFEEHGYVFTLLSVRPKTVYVQGLARHWNRRTKEDFWQQELQHIGQQEVLRKEVYAAAASPDGIFGYQDRYDEYRRAENTVAGEFRTTVLDYWHMARIFASEPALNASFVSCVPSERNFASAINDVLYIKANHSIQARRLVAPTGKSFIY